MVGTSKTGDRRGEATASAHPARLHMGDCGLRRGKRNLHVIGKQAGGKSCVALVRDVNRLQSGGL